MQKLSIHQLSLIKGGIYSLLSL
uniref:Autoinducing peptide n=1 Tax=Limosilactobacillus reuteri TaxID=1598 RepID=U3RBV1_LIMRT|nr:autoinducing peptide [Limosilactobacillus reuteri]AGX01617.1 autoinducing peptide [Limosilactobacillus reuteri]AGX01619.1 autoinducing peptide [Limosilactobacillus reuteri]AGX01623.1 autoinducing peptide [Limosilactobacillus reuteri]